MQNVSNEIMPALAVVSKTIKEILMKAVDLNVSSAQTVHLIRPVSVINAKILAQVFVVQMPFVMSLIMFQPVIVCLAILETHLELVFTTNHQQLSHQLLTRVDHHLVVQTVNAKKLMELLYARANQHLLDPRLTVDQNVLSMLSVQVIRLVISSDALILAEELVVWTQDVKLLITIQSVVVQAV